MVIAECRISRRVLFPIETGSLGIFLLFMLQVSSDIAKDWRTGFLKIIVFLLDWVELNREAGALGLLGYAARLLIGASHFIKFLEVVNLTESAIVVDETLSTFLQVEDFSSAYFHELTGVALRETRRDRRVCLYQALVPFVLNLTKSCHEGSVIPI